MPELPDVLLYVEKLRDFCAGHRLERVRVANPFVLRTFDPPITALHGRTLETADSIGKRLVLGFGDDLFCVIHLMIAGRIRRRKPGAALSKKVGHAAFDLDDATLILTEASSHKRASIHVVRGRAALADFDRGGLDVFETDVEAFRAALTRERRTLKRALTDPRNLSGVGNAYSDEILWAAGLSPTQLTPNLKDDEWRRLHAAARDTLRLWIDRLRTRLGDRFPDKVTAFHPDMAVHGKYDQPCPRCATAVQRIVYAHNECNYCPRCQTAGRLLADRALSQLLKKDRPKRIEDIED